MDREGPAGREREWRRFVEAERAALENRRRGQLAKLLGGALPGERREELERLAREDRSRAELGLVELRDDGVYYKHVDDLTPEDLRARAKAEEAQKAWLTGRLRKLTGDRPRRDGRPSPRSRRAVGFILPKKAPKRSAATSPASGVTSTVCACTWW